MKSLKEKLKNEGFEVYSMANLRPEQTGLPMVIWVSGKSGKHGPRIKVSKKQGLRFDPEDTITVTVEEEPKQIGGDLSKNKFEKVKEFINKNMIILLKYWNYKIATVDFFNGIEKVD